MHWIGSKRYIRRQASTARLAEAADNPRSRVLAFASAGNLRKSRF
ncbi:Hypothetical protein AFL40_1088 [Mycobacterium tuberculosis]|nr:Hypothetical protein AFL40_1088 [Mycobacterium tuberculosis]ANZ81688.1 Hypothetical protein BEE65_1085 [Mycobacterium tuberculosis]AOE35390.1 Hypothetical protein BEE64_1083 [Mycobacterium tuberculosis]BAL64963.1 hypothetical protein ERDMAN_1159 [Mycobacterium tuberculosis str. Erdman = ATCC 35801]